MPANRGRHSHDQRHCECTRPDRLPVCGHDAESPRQSRKEICPRLQVLIFRRSNNRKNRLARLAELQNVHYFDPCALMSIICEHTEQWTEREVHRANGHTEDRLRPGMLPVSDSWRLVVAVRRDRVQVITLNRAGSFPPSLLPPTASSPTMPTACVQSHSSGFLLRLRQCGLRRILAA
jgi:hypothetical protein